VIQSFASKETEELFHYQHSRRFRAFERVALRKLLQLHAATELRILASPPGNQLEALRATERDSTRSGLTISGGFASSGETGIGTT
jgi:proteic killer suppression protein